MVVIVVAVAVEVAVYPLGTEMQKGYEQDVVVDDVEDAEDDDDDGDEDDSPDDVDVDDTVLDKLVHKPEV